MTYVHTRGITLKIRLDRVILLVEVGQIGHKVLDHVGMRKWVNATFMGGVGRDAAYDWLTSHVP